LKIVYMKIVYMKIVYMKIVPFWVFLLSIPRLLSIPPLLFWSKIALI